MEMEQSITDYFMRKIESIKEDEIKNDCEVHVNSLGTSFECEGHIYLVEGVYLFETLNLNVRKTVPTFPHSFLFGCSWRMYFS